MTVSTLINGAFIVRKEPGTRPPLYSAALAGTGMVPVVGKTKEEAVEKLLTRMRDVERLSGTRAYYFAEDGTVFAVHYAHGGWAYDVVKPGDVRGHTTIIGNDFNECCDFAQRHALNHTP